MENFNNCTPEQEQQIDETLRLVAVVWKENPELRFGQLLANCYPKGEDIYYKYDCDIMEALIKRYL